MKPDKNISLPIYRQIEEWIRDKISIGEWPVHYKLKAETDLAEDLSVSRGTVRKSIQNLVKAGLLTQVHGKGTFVASSKLEQPLAQRLVSFAEAVTERGLSFETIVLAKEVTHPTKRLASFLELKDNDEVLYLKRVRTVDNVPIVLLENYIALKLCPTIKDVDFHKTTLFFAIENKCGLKIDWGQRSFEARTVDREQSELLKIPVGTPILYLEQIVYLKNGNPIECSDVWLRGDRFRLSSIMKR